MTRWRVSGLTIGANLPAGRTSILGCSVEPIQPTYMRGPWEGFDLIPLPGGGLGIKPPGGLPPGSVELPSIATPAHSVYAVPGYLKFLAHHRITVEVDALSQGEAATLAEKRMSLLIA